MIAKEAAAALAEQAEEVAAMIAGLIKYFKRQSA
jgi:hypothetical protein